MEQSEVFCLIVALPLVMVSVLLALWTRGRCLLFLPAVLFAFGAALFTVVEHWCWPGVFNALEHLCYALTGVSLGGACWLMVLRRAPEEVGS